MLHLLQQCVNPFLSLSAALKDWSDISHLLREAPRRRCLQCQDYID